MMSLIDGTAFQRALTVAVLFIVIFSAYGEKDDFFLFNTASC